MSENINKENQNRSLSKNVEQLTVQTNYLSPKLNNYEEIYHQIKTISDRYNQVIIPNAAQANEISKRGGLLTQMRKAESQAIEMRTKVHREAKLSYSDFDDKMNTLIDLIHSNINHLSSQAEQYKQQQDEKRYNEIKQMFTDIENSYQFKNLSHIFVDFNQFYENKMLHNMSDEKIKELVVQYLSLKMQDNIKMVKFFQAYPDITKVPQLIQSFRNNYKETQNVDSTIITILEQKKAIDKLVKEKANAEIAKQRKLDKEKLEQEKQNQKNNLNNSAQNESTQSTKNDNIKGVSFEVYDLSKVSIIKQFLDKNNIKFTPRFIK